MGFKFGYIVIPEKHKDGAYHFHVLFKDYPESIYCKNKLTLLLDEFYSDNNNFATYSEKRSSKSKGKYFFFTRFKFGRSQCEFIRDKDRISSYVKKYITKDLCTDPYAKRYFCSRNLLRPVIVYNMFPSNSPQLSANTPYLETDFFKIYDIYYDDYPTLKSLIDLYRLKLPDDSVIYTQSFLF